MAVESAVSLFLGNVSHAYMLQSQDLPAARNGTGPCNSDPATDLECLSSHVLVLACPDRGADAMSRATDCDAKSPRPNRRPA